MLTDPLDKLTEVVLAGVRQMTINPAMIQFALSLTQNGIKTALVTGNMDIFSEITVPEKKLAEVFPVIVNSFDYKMSKGGRLFDIALDKLELSSYQGVWLIDDSPGMCTLFTEKGGHAYQYSGQEEFERWLAQSPLA